MGFIALHFYKHFALQNVQLCEGQVMVQLFVVYFGSDQQYLEVYIVFLVYALVFGVGGIFDDAFLQGSIGFVQVLEGQFELSSGKSNFAQQK